MAKDLEDQLKYLLRKGDQQDVLQAMLRYRWLRESAGRTPKQIEAEFGTLLKRVFRTAEKK